MRSLLPFGALAALLVVTLASADPPPPAPPPPRIPTFRPLPPQAPAGAPAAAPTPGVAAPMGAPAVRRPVAAKRRVTPVPAGPAPQVSLALDATTATGPWTARITNEGEVPVMIDADARLLTLEVTPRGARRAVTCALPADMRPTDNVERALVLGARRSYVESFSPRLYCFGEHGLDALASGAVVVGHLGWGAGARDATHQAVWPVAGVEPALASVPTLTSPPIGLPDEPTPALAPIATTEAPTAEPVALRLTSARAVDAGEHESITVAVTLHNDGAHPVRVRFRPDTLAFEASSSTGAARCAWPVPPSAPTRELFSTIPAGGSESLSVQIADYCRRQLFDEPGLVVLRALLDTRHASGGAIGLKTFDDVVIATRPTLVRLHRGTGAPRWRRPVAEPAAPGASSN